MKIITHPANLELVKRHCAEISAGRGIWEFPIEIRLNQHMERDKPTGRYTLPDGRTVPREQVAVPDGRFFEWGNSDLEIKLLLEWGKIREEREPLFYVVDEERLFRYFDRLPMLIREPAFVVTTSL